MILMVALNPKARALVEAGRGALRALPSDRQRVETALRTKLGVAALPQPTPPAPPVAHGIWHLAPKLAIGVGLVGGAALLGLQPTSNVPASGRTTPSHVAQVVAAPHSVASVTAEPAVTPEEPREKKLLPEAPAPAVRPQDRLAQEVALLSRATSDLRAGRAADALSTLDEHQRKFPTGALSEERRAARAQALCSLGRVSEGRAELSRLAPHSPAAARAEQLCSAAGSRKP